MGASGSIGTNSRASWPALNARLTEDDTLVVAAIDRIGRRWMDTVNAVRDLRVRGVKIKSLSAAEASWASCLAADPGTPEAFLADTLLSFMAWASEQELEATRRRTVAGLTKARAEGKILGPPVSWALTRWRQRAGCGAKRLACGRLGGNFGFPPAPSTGT